MTRSPHRHLTALAAAAATAVAAVALTAVPARAAGTEHVTNGTFSSTLDPWWATSNVTMQLTSGRLCAKVPANTTNAWDAMVGYNGIPLVKGDSYTVKFDASASVASTVKANLQLSEDPYTATLSRGVALTSKLTTFTYTFVSTLDAEVGQFSFQLGGGTKAYTFCLDNVSVTSEPASVEPTGPDQVRNGGFDDGTSGWFSYGTDTSSVTDGKLCAVAPAGLTNIWDAGVGQSDLSLEEGTNYTLSFEASASPAASVKAVVQLGVDPYTAYFSDTVALTSTAKKFSYTFTASTADPAAQIVFQIGGGSQPLNFCLDNVSLRGGA